MEESKISVIIPVYNVEAYVEKCIRSVMGQTYENLEIWLIDDGSTDKSGEICEKCAGEDSRIRVLHKENGGLSDARNAGIDRAAGDFITFIDSDDYIDRTYVEQLLRLIAKTGADIAVCNFKEVLEAGDLKPENSEVENLKPEIEASEGKNTEKYKLLTRQEALEQYFGELPEQVTVAWGKLYPIGYFKKIRFPKGKLHEDEFTTYRLLYRAQQIVYTEQKLYCYLQRSDGITGSRFKLRNLDAIEAFEERMEFLKKEGLETLYKKTLVRTMDYYKKDYFLLKMYYPEEKERAAELKKKFAKTYRSNKKILPISLKKRVLYQLFNAFGLGKAWGLK